MKCSRKSVENLIKTALGVAVEHCVHQTLTFSPQVTSAVTAKAKLQRLLDNLHKQYQMGTIYVMEQHGNGAWHFHVLFLFFNAAGLPCAPSRLSKDFGKIVFDRWNALQGGKLTRLANRTRQYKRIEISYLLKGIEVLPDQNAPRGEFNWWGTRNKSLLRQFACPVDSSKLSIAIAPCLRPPKASSKTIEPQAYSRAQLKKDREWVETFCETAGAIDWETFKMSETGRKSPVSDEKFYRFKNGQDPFNQALPSKTSPFDLDD